MRVLIACHPDFLPPKSATYKASHKAVWKTEYDVKRALTKLGHSVEYGPISTSLEAFDKYFKEYQPDLVFNLLEEFNGETDLEFHIVNYLEKQNIPYSGCGWEGLLLARRKAASKYILKHKKLLTPNFNIIYDVRRSKTKLRKVFFPAIVKYANEDASLGINKSSLVKDYTQAIKQIKKMNDIKNAPILVERFIEGREFHMAVFSGSGKNVQVFKPIETVFTRAKKLSETIATEQIKWNLKLRRKKKVVLRPIKTEKEAWLEKELIKVAKKAYKALYLKGFARFDVRVDQKNRIYIIDVNPNPDLGQGFETDEILRSSGYSYTELINMAITI